MMRMALRLVFGVFCIVTVTASANDVTLATAEDVDWLQSQLPKGYVIGEKLFRLKEDWNEAEGFSVGEVFHDFCDNQGPTVTIVKNSAGGAWGGFSDVSWEATAWQTPMHSDVSFLFTLGSHNHGQQKLSLTGNNNDQAVRNWEYFGPCWTDACIKWMGKGVVQLGTVYEGANGGTSLRLAPKKHFDIYNFEVFKVVPFSVASNIASVDDFAWLDEQLGDYEIVERLFVLSEDWEEGTGSPEEAFHAKCDLYIPTVTIVKNASGVIWGGFSTAPWLSEGFSDSLYTWSDTAFLFTLESDKFGREKLSLTGENNEQAIVSNADRGPCWDDACIYSDNGGYANLGSTYEKANGGTEPYLEDGSRFFEVTDYEVYRVE